MVSHSQASSLNVERLRHSHLQGFLYPEPDVGWFYSLQVSTVEGAVYALGGTVAFRGRSRLQAYQIRAYIEGASTAEALGVARVRVAERKARVGGADATSASRADRCCARD